MASVLCRLYETRAVSTSGGRPGCWPATQGPRRSVLRQLTSREHSPGTVSGRTQGGHRPRPREEDRAGTQGPEAGDNEDEDVAGHRSGWNRGLRPRHFPVGPPPGRDARQTHPDASVAGT